MSSFPNDSFSDTDNRWAGGGPADETLRLIAKLPAPDGLADRVQAGLRTAPAPGRVLQWRGSVRSSGQWIQSTMARGAAAAAIVCVVAGGGWRIYSTVQPAANVLVMPAPAKQSGARFGQAGGKRIPETLEGPKLTHPVAEMPEATGVSDSKATNPAPDAKTAAVRPPAKKAAATQRKRADSKIMTRPAK